MAATDVFITSGYSWARDRGIPKHSVSVRRFADHAHVINCMFDMANLAAVVVKGKPGYSAQVIPTSICPVC